MDTFNVSAHVDRLRLRLGHFAEVAEAANDGLEIGDFHPERARALVEDFIEFFRGKFTCSDEVLDGELQGEERVLELVSQSAGELAPGGDSFALHETFALRSELACHVIKTSSQDRHLIAATLGDAHIPVAGSDVFSRAGKLLDWMRDAGGDPKAECNG